MRVGLVRSDLALLDAAIDDQRALGRALRCELAEGWDVFAPSLRRMRDAVAADPDSARWGSRFFVVDEPRTLVGWGGFKGPPSDGVVELGYAVAPGWEGCGVATAAVGEMVREAFAAPDVQSIVAHTRAQAGASPRVLQKAGFVFEGDVINAEVGMAWRFRLDRPCA